MTIIVFSHLFIDTYYNFSTATSSTGVNICKGLISVLMFVVLSVCLEFYSIIATHVESRAKTLNLMQVMV